jgi:hypothetical protein
MEVFGATGLSVPMMPARSEGGRIVAAIEVIGPTRINFDQINPDPDHVGRVIGRL